MTQPAVTTKWVPEDTFADRLARVRRRMGWNLKEADREIGWPSGKWRTYEVEDRSPQDVISAVKRIALRTGVDELWLLGYPGTGAQNLKSLRGQMPALRALAVAA